MTPRNLLCTSLPLLIAATIFAGCEPKRNNNKEISDLMAQFRSQERIELLTILPNQEGGPDSILGYPILDKRIIEQESDREALLGAFEAAAVADDSGPKPACFWPRHALRLPDDPETYILICFQCVQATYRYDNAGGGLGIRDIGKASSQVFQKYVEELDMTNSDLYFP